MVDPRRSVPRTDTVLADPTLLAAADRLGPVTVKAAVRSALARVREGSLAAADVVAAAHDLLPTSPGGLTAVINATGVVVHTNLGRAPLAPAAVAALVTAAGPTDVEFDLVTGERARRGRGTLAALRDAVPDAGAVHVVNNAAAALVLCATALGGAGREIVVSRGEMVEIGDGFRLPDLLESTGARLREVGTTNRTTVEDYAAAIGPDTGFVLKIHPSNFVVQGFTAEASIADLSRLGVPVVADIGSGLLQPHPVLPAEPDVRSALRDGATVVLCSGDKLLGGPQAGLLFGTADTVEAVRRHPLARALRVDKLTLAALQATLQAGPPPVASMLTVDVAVLRTRAAAIVRELDGVDVSVVDTVARVGGGGAPGVDLPSAGLSLPEPCAATLRTGRPPVVGHVVRGRCVLDLRTVAPDRDDDLVAAVRAAAGTG